jgi:hypothetical protein
MLCLLISTPAIKVRFDEYILYVYYNLCHNLSVSWVAGHPGIRLEPFMPATMEETIADMVSMGTFLDVTTETQSLIERLRKT